MERRLAAILLTDMVGYSRLMGLDEEGTITRQRAHRDEIFDPKVSAHGGRIVKTTGDGLLVEFPSVVDAVKCAVDVQRELDGLDTDVSEDHAFNTASGSISGTSSSMATTSLEMESMLQLVLKDWPSPVVFAYPALSMITLPAKWMSFLKMQANKRSRTCLARYGSGTGRQARLCEARMMSVNHLPSRTSRRSLFCHSKT